MTKSALADFVSASSLITETWSSDAGPIRRAALRTGWTKRESR